MTITTRQSPIRRAKLTAALPLLGFSLLSLYAADSFAVPANPSKFKIAQPNGQKIAAINQGDEWNNWVETQKGYTIAKASDGVWYYVNGFNAVPAAPGLPSIDAPAQEPVLTGVQAGNPAPSGLAKHLRPAARTPARSGDTAPAGPNQISSLVSSSNTTGTRNVVFILAEFNNRAGTYAQSTWASFVTNNLGDFYAKASHGNVTIAPAQETHGAANNGVIGWINVSTQLAAIETSLGKSDTSGNHPNTGGSTNQYNRLLAKAAMMAADPYIDYSQYDADANGYVTADELAVVVIVAGYEASYDSSTPSVWGHAWRLYSGNDGPYPVLDGKTLGVPKSGVGPLGETSGYAEFGEIQGNHQATLGIMAHELGHEIFGFADLYDVDNSTISGQTNNGLGSWSLMSGGSWGAASSQFPGASPVLPDAWSKLQMGWVNPISPRDRILLTGAGAANATPDNTVYKVATNGAATEYFLIENRQNQGYDRGIQADIPTFSGGLAIYHIDDSISCTDNRCNSHNAHPNHPRVYLRSASRDWILGNTWAQQADLWYADGGWKTVLDSASSPNSNLWSGAASGVSINSISNSLATMRVRVPQ